MRKNLKSFLSKLLSTFIVFNMIFSQVLPIATVFADELFSENEIVAPVDSDEESEETDEETTEEFVSDLVSDLESNFDNDFENSENNFEDEVVIEDTEVQPSVHVGPIEWYQNNDGSYTTTSNVIVDRYIFPEDERISLNFTKVTQDGTVTIQKVYLGEDQMSELNSVYAWAIEVTSTMDNGSFEYTLEMPKPTSEESVTVAYSEDWSEFTKVESEVVGDKVVADLDHFTIFVIIDPNPVSIDCNNAGFPVESGDSCYNTIQEAINAASDGDEVYVGAGTYSENVIINKEITLQGVGNADDPTTNTILLSNSGTTITVLSSNVTIRDLRITPVNSAGIQVGTMTNPPVVGDTISISNLTITNVMVIGPATYSGTENEIGLKVMVNGTLDGLEISNSSFNNLHYGFYFAKNPAGTNPAPDTFSNVTNVIVTNSTFNSNGFKGIYAEKLSNAIFTNITASNNGQNTTSGLSAHNAGIDLNLKNGNYSNITFNNPTISGNGLGVTHGKGIAIKGRNDTAGYGLNTTSLTGVTINGGSITSNGGTTVNGGGISIGNHVTDVVIQGATISGNNNFGLVNWTTTTNGDISTTVLVDARGNNWGDVNGPRDTISGDGSIPETNTTGMGNSVFGMVDYSELDTTPPSSPLFWVEEDSTSIKIDWKTVVDAVLYRVYSNEDLTTPIYEGVDLSFVHNTTGSNKYIVTALDSTGNESDTDIEWKHAETMDIVIDDNALYSDYNNNGTFSVSGMTMAIHVNHADPSVQSIASSYVGGDVQTLRAVDAQATWTTNDVLTGVYEVYTQYRCEPSTSRMEVNYAVLGNNISIDQSICPTSYEQSQTGWISLGQYEFDNQNGEVILTAPAWTSGKIAIADAVAFRYIRPLTPTQIGYNVNDGTPIDQRPTRFACEGGFTNINGVSVHWTDVSNGNPDISYQRQYSSNGTNWAGSEPYAYPYTNYRSFGYGEVPHYSRVRAINNVTGTTSEWSNSCYITYDTTAPVITFTNDIEIGPVQSDTIEISVTELNPNTTTYQYAFTDGTCNSTVTFDNSYNSDESFVINTEDYNGMYICTTATDLAGNTSYERSARTLNIDNTAPKILESRMYVNGAESYLTKPGDTVRIEADVIDNLSGVDRVQIWVREYPWNPNNNQLVAGEMTHDSGDTYYFEFIVPVSYQNGNDLNESFEGNYFNFRPWDNLGNSHIGWRTNFTIDATPPTTPTWINTPIFSHNVYNGSVVEMRFRESTDASGIQRYQYQYVRRNLDGSLAGQGSNVTPNASCSGGECVWRPTAQQDSMWVFRIRAIDLAGNTSDWSNWNDATDSEFRNFGFSYDDYVNNSGVFGRDDYNPTEGNHGFIVREDNNPVSEITSPSTSNSPHYTNNSSLDISYISYDEDTDVKNVRLYVSINGGSYVEIDRSSNSNGTFEYSLTEEGTYCFNTRAEDIADHQRNDFGQGNVEGAKGCVLEVIYDNTPPTIDNISIMIEYSGQYVNGLTGFMISARVNDSLSGINPDSCEYTLDGTSWNSGTYMMNRCIFMIDSSQLTDEDLLDIQVRVEDRAGNSATSDVVERQVDGLFPEVGINELDPYYGPISPTPFITGWANDTVSDITDVRVTIRRASDGRYWNGSRWVRVMLMPPMLRTSGTDIWEFLGSPSYTNEETYIVTPYAWDEVHMLPVIGSSVVFIWDSEAPELEVYDIVKEAVGPTGVEIEFTPTATDNIDGDVSSSVVCDHNGGDVYPIGVTTVTCSVEDSVGNVTVESFTITVQDTTAPVLNLPANISVNTTNSNGIAVSYTVTATDIVDPNPVVLCTPITGSVFAVGTTTVNCTATDTYGNSSTGSFLVTVNKEGCTDTSATNYDPQATINNNTCTYPVAPIIVPRVLPPTTPDGTPEAPVDTEETTEEDDQGEVLGTEERRCETTQKVSGYVYEDKNKNEKKDSREKGFENVTVVLEYEYEGKTYEVRVETNEDGYWETNVCPGKYTVRLSEQDIPEGYVLGEEQEITVTDSDELTDINLGLLDENQNRFSLWWLLLIIPLLAMIGLVILSLFRKEKN